MRRLVVTGPAGLVLAGSVLVGLVLAGCAQRERDAGSTGTPLPPTTPVSASEVPVPPQLSPHGKDVLAQARRSGATTVGLTISTDRDETDTVADRVRALGATVEATDATIGYVRASVPVEVAEKVAAVEGVSRVDVDEPLGNADPTP
ncbi:hypothetical protein AB0G02_10005 [Actinosynnema sp. NPDC023658]|uniref:hypothetical protein n=1 Tax=Actinosynnema sp. NPDC023658 TaxID=3155465 RepID=UPI0033D77D04